MRKWLPLIFLLSAFAAQALELPKDMQDGEPVRIDKGFWGTRFRQGSDSRVLKLNSIQYVVGAYPDAKPDVTAFKVWGYSGLVLGGVGGFLFGFSLGQTLGGEELNQPLFYTGVGLMAVSIVFSKLSENRLVRAVEKYNAALPAKVGMDWNYAPERSHLALQLRF